MTQYSVSREDSRFRDSVESGELPVEDFDHRAHLRLAYVYLAGHEIDEACLRMRDVLLRFLASHGVDSGKYHETLTRAWIMAVRHFMQKTPACRSADAFIDANPEMLDPDIMLTHYSARLLFSEDARHRFVEPDLAPIPPDDSR